MIKSKIAGGVVQGRVDRLLTPELAENAARQRLERFLETMDAAILNANRDIIGNTVHDLPQEALLRLIVRVAELRADYVKCGLRVAEHRHPDTPLIDELETARRAYEELMSVYLATERAIERGYVRVIESPAAARGATKA